MKSVYLALLIAIGFSFVGVIKAFELKPANTAPQYHAICKSTQPNATCYNNAGYIIGTYALVSSKTSLIEIGDLK